MSKFRMIESSLRTSEESMAVEGEVSMLVVVVVVVVAAAVVAAAAVVVFLFLSAPQRYYDGCNTHTHTHTHTHTSGYFM